MDHKVVKSKPNVFAIGVARIFTEKLIELVLPFFFFQENFLNSKLMGT